MAPFDAFKPDDAVAFRGYDAQVSERFWRRVDRVSSRLGVVVEGIEHIPKGRALLVMNHAFGWDAMLPMAAIRRVTGRRIWALGEHLWWKLPLLRKLAASVGTVDGTPQNVDALLEGDELVLVLPGGLREALKPHQLRYRLLWGNRFGFVRAAMRNHASLVPLAGIGADDLFDFEGDAYTRGKRWLGLDLPLPRPSFGLPIPHLRPLKYIIGEPVAPDALAGETSDATTRRIRREVRGAIEEIIDEELAVRSQFGVRPR